MEAQYKPPTYLEDAVLIAGDSLSAKYMGKEIARVDHLEKLDPAIAAWMQKEGVATRVFWQDMTGKYHEKLLEVGLDAPAGPLVLLWDKHGAAVGEPATLAAKAYTRAVRGEKQLWSWSETKLSSERLVARYILQGDRRLKAATAACHEKKACVADVSSAVEPYSALTDKIRASFAAALKKEAAGPKLRGP